MTLMATKESKGLQDLVLISGIGVCLLVSLGMLVSLLQPDPDSGGTGKGRGGWWRTSFWLGYARMHMVPENAKQTEIH